MCGINGFVHDNQIDHGSAKSLIHQMNQVIFHRGPDEGGSFVDETVAIGNRRLSIIDLASGSQPIFNEDESLVIVLNGEIYNYLELRDHVLSRGHRLKTSSDTEVILHLYEEEGKACLKRLRGMFVFCIYDRKEKSLFLARDRAGEKPLYYSMQGDRFAFASELKSLLQLPWMIKVIDQEALTTYLSLTYIPAPQTIFKHIYKLEPGCLMVFKGQTIEIEKYWDIEQKQLENLDAGTQVKKFRQLMFDAVEESMVSDVPIGAFLSGGIDSSIVTGIMSKIAPKKVKTFSIGFENKDFDESLKAKQVSELFKTDHHTAILDYTKADQWIEMIMSKMDEPFADSSALPTYFVSQFAKEYVTVALTGDAGDELFGGYSKYLIHDYARRYQSIPAPIRHYALEPLVKRLPDSHSMMRKIKKVVRNHALNETDRHIGLMKLGFSETTSLLKSKQNWDSSRVQALYEGSLFKDPLSRALYVDFKIGLEGDMLTKVDRMSMLASLETRAPFLNPHVIEYAFSLPTEYKINKGVQKWILKEAFSDLLPESIIKQSKKGFGVPVGDWFRGPLKNRMQFLLSREIVEKQGIFEFDTVHQFLEEHIQFKENHSFRLWTLFVFQEWYLRMFESEVGHVSNK